MMIKGDIETASCFSSPEIDEEFYEPHGWRAVDIHIWKTISYLLPAKFRFEQGFRFLKCIDCRAMQKIKYERR
jgi:hypothetical protein